MSQLPASLRTTRPLAAMMFRLPMMIDCVAFEEFILDYLDGTLPRRQRIVFEVHLRLCRGCRRYLRDYKNTIAMTQAQFDIPFSQTGMGDVPADLVKAVLAARQDADSD